ATGKLHVDRMRLDLRAVFDNVIDVCEPGMDARRQSFVICVPDRALIVEGDLIRLSQVFTNLLNNASKYTPVDGDILLDCRVKVIGERAAEVVVTVSRHGI